MITTFVIMPLAAYLLIGIMLSISIVAVVSNEQMQIWKDEREHFKSWKLWQFKALILATTTFLWLPALLVK